MNRLAQGVAFMVAFPFFLIGVAYLAIWDRIDGEDE